VALARSVAVAWASDSLQQAVAAKAYTVTLGKGIKHVDSHTHEASVLATITSPTKAGYTTAARDGDRRAAHQGGRAIGGPAECARVEVVGVYAPLVRRKLALPRAIKGRADPVTHHERRGGLDARG